MRLCNVNKCVRFDYRNGYCSLHYQRFMRYGDPLFTQNGRDQESHGMKYTQEYKIWSTMKQRCNNSNCKDYKYYGGRGIKVYDKWNNSFLAFYEDMGKKPFPKATIDRIDNDGNYEPDNCKWVSRTINNQNKSKYKKLRRVNRMTIELNTQIKSKLSELIESIADAHIVGKPALLAIGMFFSTEKFLIEQINKIETTFKD